MSYHAISCHVMLCSTVRLLPISAILVTHVSEYLHIFITALPSFLTDGIYNSTICYQWAMMTEILIMIKDRQVTFSPRMITLCSGNIPPAVKEKFLRMIRGVPSGSNSDLIEDSVVVSPTSQHKGLHAENLHKKTKKVRKMKKSLTESTDILVPSLQEATVARPLDPTQHNSEGKKRVKC